MRVRGHRTGLLVLLFRMIRMVKRRLSVGILGLLDFLKQVEAESIFAFMAYRQIREDKVASRIRAVQVGHSSNGHSSQDRDRRLRCRHTTLRHRTSGLQCGEQKEIGIVGEGNIALGISLKYAKLNDWRWVDRTAIGRRWPKYQWCTILWIDKMM